MELDTFTIRALQPSDSISELTDFLHHAYTDLADMGLKYVAVDQTEETTRRRVAGGECLLALNGAHIVGTITFHDAARTDGSPWYDRADVASFEQFAVEPTLRRQGLGSLLIARIEGRARETGAREIALDTAEQAEHLIALYTAKGYRFIEHVQWSVTNYRSVVLSKTLP